LPFKRYISNNQIAFFRRRPWEKSEARLEAKIDEKFGKIDEKFGKIDEKFDNVEAHLAK
jgi:hypothetical protein